MLFYINGIKPNFFAILGGSNNPTILDKRLDTIQQVSNDSIQLHDTRILTYNLGSAYLYNFGENIVKKIPLPQYDTSLLVSSNIHLFNENFLITGLQERHTSEIFKLAIMDYDFNIISRIPLLPPNNKQVIYIHQLKENGLFALILQLFNRGTSTYSIIIANINMNQINIIKTIDNVPKMDVIVYMDKNTLLSIAYDSPIIKVWDVSRETGHEFVKDLFTPDRRNLNKIIPIDTHRFATKSQNDKTIKIWDLEKVFSGELSLTLEGHSKFINQITIIDTNTLVSASDDGNIIFWNLSSGTPFRTINTGSPVIEVLHVSKTTNPEKLSDLAYKAFLETKFKTADFLQPFSEIHITENINKLQHLLNNYGEVNSMKHTLDQKIIDKHNQIYIDTKKTNIKTFLTSFNTFLSETISQYDKQIKLFKDFSDPISHLQGLRDWFMNILSQVSYLEKRSDNLFQEEEEEEKENGSAESKTSAADGRSSRRRRKKSPYRKKDGSSSRSRPRIKPKKSTKKNKSTKK